MSTYISSDSSRIRDSVVKCELYEAGVKLRLYEGAYMTEKYHPKSVIKINMTDIEFLDLITMLEASYEKIRHRVESKYREGQKYE